MMSIPEVCTLISAFSALVAIFMSLKGNKRTDANDIAERVKENTRINMKLDETINLSKETKNEVSMLRREINEHNDRIIKVEESAKQAHHRLDAVEERLNVHGGK